MKYYEDPAPADTPTNEADFETKGKAAIAAVDALTPTWAQTRAGDSDGGAVKDFAPWFSDLQDKLSASVQWSDAHEAAHKLLYRYAVWKVGTQWGMNPIPANIEYLFRFLGKAEDNQPPISRMNGQIRMHGGVLMTESSAFFGSPGAAAWCAPASSIPIQAVLRKLKIALMDGGDPQGAWAKRANIVVAGDDLDAVAITPGDYLQMVGHGGPLSGHIATAMRVDPATGPAQTIWYVSGNAGRFGGGAIRIDSVTRERPPAGYSYRRVSGLGNDRNNLGGDIKKREANVEKLRSQGHWDGSQVNDVTDGNNAAEARRLEVQRKIDADNAAIAADRAQIARDDQSLIDEAAKARPGESASTADAAEKMLKPKTPGTIWLTYVATTGKMDLNSLKPSADPSMAAWMKRWRASATR
jgi:hypothetical protein